MPRILVALFTALLIALAPLNLSAYSSSQSATGSTDGAARTFNFTSLPAASGTVTVSVFVRGDFNSSSEYVDVFVDGTDVGNADGTSQYNSNSNCLQGTTNFTVPASYVADGSLSVLVDATSAVNYSPCEPWTYTVTVSYTSNTAPSISNVGNQSINEDSTGTVGFTVSDSEDSNSSLSVTATSSNTSVIANGGLSISGTGSNRTLTMNPVANASGQSTITLTVTDSVGATDTDTFTLTVNAVNDPPVADAGGPYTGNEGSAISLDGSGSSDIDDTITTWDWDCDNDGVFEVTSSSATGAACTFDDDGSYPVVLRVTDAAGGQSGHSTTTATVGNLAPSVSINGSPSGNEGSSITIVSSATDPSSVDAAALVYSWSISDPAGNVVQSGSGPGITFTPDDDGTWQASVTVTDPQGATATDTVSVPVANVDPTIGISGSPTLNEGDAGSWTLSPADVSTVDASNLSTAWTITDSGGSSVANGTGTAVAWTPADDGTYTLDATVTDPQGATGTASLGLTVANVAPTATASGPTTGDEGTLASFSVAPGDVGATDAANLTIAWDLTDAAGTSLATGNAASFDWTPADDGTYTATVVVTDPQGATATDSVGITVANVAPEITSFTGPATGDEGSVLSFAATVDDVGTGDLGDLVLTWDWGDGSATETGLNPDHTWADDGTYTVTVTLDDQDGGTDSETMTVTVDNVAPVIDTTPSATASESVLYSYAPTVTDPGDEVFTWSISASAPPSMTIDPATGQLDWTPDYADALVGSYAIVLTVDDGDGGTDAQSWTVYVDVLDADADGLPDGWELANGLDPTDPNDATADPDADGLDNTEELAAGQDPNSYDGPDAPTLVDPIAGVEVDTDTPDLLWDDATDPQNDVLTYDVEIYSDAAMTTLVASATGIAAGGSGQSTWKVDTLLAENAEHWWRARADDGWVAGPWTTEDSFVVNAINEEPDVPVLTAPIGGTTAASATPTLQWSEAADIDGDAVTYDVEVLDSEGNLVAATTEVAGDGVAAEWTVDVTLDEDATYSWTARAVDEHGLAGDWAVEETFFLSTDNAPPSDPVFVQPLDGDVISEVSPVLIASQSTDPEGGTVEYVFEVDSLPTFDSADFATATTTDPVWDLEADGIVLAEDAESFARVRSIDEGGVSSATNTIVFFVSASNNAPEVPVLSAPEDGAEVTSTPILVVEDPEDPEGDVVYIEFAVATDAELTDVVTGIEEVIVAGTGTTEWLVPTRLEGTHYWTARAVDANGAASDWATPWSFVAPGGEAEVPPPPPEETGCDCESSVARGSASLVWLLLVPVLAIRRRR